jgi:hypothetical protein
MISQQGRRTYICGLRSTVGTGRSGLCNRALIQCRQAVRRRLCRLYLRLQFVSDLQFARKKCDEMVRTFAIVFIPFAEEVHTRPVTREFVERVDCASELLL